MWQGEQSLACPGCSQPRDEVWVYSPEEQRDKEAKWSARTRHCVACASRDWRRRTFESDETNNRDGVHVVLERNGDG